LEGLEAGFDKYLQGPRATYLDTGCQEEETISRIDNAEVGHGNSSNLMLTIDSRMQHLAEVQLKEAVRNKGAKGGVAIIMDTRTGEVLAMANEWI